jgi:hypothetical protein
MANEIQLSFSEQPAIGVAGQLVYGFNNQIRSGLASSRKLVEVTPTASNSKIYTVTLNGTAFAYTADASATVAEIVTGLAALINAGTVPVTAIDNTTTLLLESDLDGAAGSTATGDFTYLGAVDSVGTLTAVTLVAQGQAVPFGTFLCMDERSTQEKAVRLPRQATDVTGSRGLGVAVADFAKVANGQAFKANVMLPVVTATDGIYVVVEEAVNKGDDAYVRYASGSGGTQLGAFRKSADTSTAAALPRASFDSTAAIGGLAKLKLNR